MWFMNKKWILEYCGKNEKDVRWLDRAIKKWVVWHDVEDTGAYMLCTEYIRELEEENVRLMVKAWLVPGYILAEDAEKMKELEKAEKEVWEIKEKVEWIQNNNEVAKLREELERTKSDLDFQIKAYDELVSNSWWALENALKKCYDLMVERKVLDWNKTDFSWFKKWSMGADLTNNDWEFKD